MCTALERDQHQSRLWRGSYATARLFIERYEQAGPHEGPHHIANMTIMFREGPYILKPYAFEWYGRAEVPRGSVTATPMVYQFRDGRVVPVRGRGKPRTEAPPAAKVLRLYTLGSLLTTSTQST